MGVERLRPLLVLVLLAGTARAEPEPRGPRARHRTAHLLVTAGAGLALAVTELGIKPSLAPEQCRWCDPPWFDRRLRNAVLWSHPAKAQAASDITVVVAATGSLTITALDALANDPTWSDRLDTILPMVESVAVAELATQVVKFSVGRARPFARFTNPPPNDDNNLSFWSGHSVLAFSAVSGAATVAHLRHSGTERWIWGIGLPLATATAYLRMGGDKHYFTDVAIGTAVGLASGLAIPRLVLRGGDAVLLPQPNGVAVVGSF